MALRIVIVLLILVVPLEIPGCGPFLPEIQFTAELVPEAPDQLAHGNLGILRPSYARLYQVIAYRYLTGVGLNDAERRAVLPPPLPAQGQRTVPSTTSPEYPWLIARNRVPGVQTFKEIKEIDVYRKVQRNGYFDTYLNCNADAFRTAASTLERVRRTGSAADWIAAQDIVFADCAQGTDIPRITSDPRLTGDRAYQIASAEFYSERYAEARQHFQAIAADASSPWHEVAPYLAARCLIRAGKLAEAEGELQRIAADPALGRWRASANEMLGYVRAHLDPKTRMHQLALALVKPASEATIGQDLTDYRLLFDQNVMPGLSDDLTDWIVNFQAGGGGAFEKWHANPTLPWLVAALQSAKSGDDAVPELLAAASRVKRDSPGYLTVSYHRVRLLPPAEARTLSTELLAGTLLTTDRNMLRAQSMRLARDFDEFLHYAPRAEVRDATEFLLDGQTVKVSPSTAAFNKLDDDSSQILDRAVPLAMLKQASTSTRLPAEIRDRLRQVVSLRTLIFAPHPDFAEVFRVLKTPGDSPIVRSDSSPRVEKPNQMSVYRDNWWCEGSQRTRYRGSSGDQSVPTADFIAPGAREQAMREWKQLAAVPSGPNWLGIQTLAFADQHPEDPRVPEALHQVVRATRLGCVDGRTGDISRRAFEILHHRYPTSEWTKKTPYWFRDD